MPDIWFWAEGVKRLYDFVVSQGAPYNSDEFVESYSEASINAIDLLRDIDSYTPEQLAAAAKGVLDAIASVVKAYHGGKAAINANYMLPVRATDDLVQRAKFCSKDRRADSFACLLELKEWATDQRDFPRGLLLPVERVDEQVSSDAVLPGAPWAFAHGKSYLVNDTLDLTKHWDHLEHQQIRVELRDYFVRHKDQLRSFISIPITTDPERAGVCAWPSVAVVNVQSNKPKLMGWFPGNRRKLEVTMVPLLHTLSHLLVRLYYHEPRETNSAPAASN